MADIENDRLKTEADIENKAMKELIEGQREAQRTQAALGLVEQNIPVNPEQI